MFASQTPNFAAKEKLEIVIGAAPPHFQSFAGSFPCLAGRQARRRRRRKAVGLIQEYCTSIKLSDFCPTDSAARSAATVQFLSKNVRAVLYNSTT